MDDLISREQALAALNGSLIISGEDNVKEVEEYIHTVARKLNDLPSIDAVPQWIPVEEASPERENESIMRHYYLTTNAYGAVSITAYEFDGRTWGVRGWNSDIRIVAWKPLPEPYKGEES